mmetsp:Transcript_140046/g.242441  ORF Transcript_140046/g.242441 Transcript_140046/m.242441 type:complete len:104 (-) Transcript_140046:25-336(-)
MKEAKVMMEIKQSVSMAFVYADGFLSSEAQKFMHTLGAKGIKTCVESAPHIGEMPTGANYFRFASKEAAEKAMKLMEDQGMKDIREVTEKEYRRPDVMGDWNF